MSSLCRPQCQQISSCNIATRRLLICHLASALSKANASPEEFLSPSYTQCEVDMQQLTSAHVLSPSTTATAMPGTCQRWSASSANVPKPASNGLFLALFPSPNKTFCSPNGCCCCARTVPKSAKDAVVNNDDGGRGKSLILIVGSLILGA